MSIRIYPDPSLLPNQENNSGKYLKTNGTSTSWAEVASYSTPTVGSTPIVSGTTVENISDLTLSDPSLEKITPTPTFLGIALNGGTLVSNNGSSWINNYLPSGYFWGGVAFGNGLYVAIANSNTSSNATTTAATSTDGINWTIRTLPSGFWKSLTYGNGKFVAVSQDSSTAAYSVDGVIWTSITLPSSQSWISISYGNGKFVAVSGGGTASTAAAYSTDGITWTAATLPSARWYSVAYGNNVFVAVARNTAVSARSTDGITWTSQTMPESSPWAAVAYGNSTFVAVSNSSAGATSADGIIWTLQTLPNRGDTITFGNNKFIVLGSDSDASYSTNGISWTSSSVGISDTWIAVTYGTPNIVSSGTLTVAGSTGTSGQVLKSTGTGVVWETIAEATSNVGLIASGSLNSGTILNITGITSDFIQIHLYGLTTLAGTRMLVRPNGSSSAVYDYATTSQRGSVSQQLLTQNGTSFDLNGTTATGAADAVNYYIITLTNCKASGFTTIGAQSAYTYGGGITANAWSSGIYKAAQQITSISITTSTGTSFNGSGTYKVYGG